MSLTDFHETNIFYQGPIKKKFFYNVFINAYYFLKKTDTKIQFNL